MGYHTDLSGAFSVVPALKPEHAAYIKAFSGTRRVERDPAIAETLPDPIRLAAGLPIGTEGGYFVGGPGFHGQEHDASVVEFNCPPAGQPGLWCQWIPTNSGIEWDGGEKFYEYIPWIKYLIDHFLRPWGYILNGSVEWEGEEQGDTGTIHIANNVVTTER